MDKIKKDIKLTTNESEQAQSYFTLITEFIKIFLGCLLVIFVVQSCPGIDPSQAYLSDYCLANITNIMTHTCTMDENFTNLIQFNEFVLFWNFLTFFVFIWNFIFEIKRERYIITNFDYNKQKNMKAIKEVFDSKPDLKEIYIKDTQKLFRLNFACIIIMILNILFSSVLIFYYYYDGFRSATSLITSILLIIQKLQKNYSILKSCINKEYVQSTILFQPYFYNTLDKEKYKTDEKFTDSDSDKSDDIIKNNKIYELNTTIESNV